MRVSEVTGHVIDDHLGTRYAAYAQIDVAGTVWYGAAIADSGETARLNAVTSAVNRAHAR
ncbi:hypothetical protein [Streptomyces sp. NPDC092952]|uniref:hypothetical protein n=1 Tax=Streptomyces sp. NPDC092952 TaxID=3366018 RepID=UPI00380F761E